MCSAPSLLFTLSNPPIIFMGLVIFHRSLEAPFLSISYPTDSKLTSMWAADAGDVFLLGKSCSYACSQKGFPASVNALWTYWSCSVLNQTIFSIQFSMTGSSSSGFQGVFPTPTWMPGIEHGVLCMRTKHSNVLNVPLNFFLSFGVDCVHPGPSGRHS